MAKVIERTNNGKLAYCVDLGVVDGKRRRRWAKSKRRAAEILRDFQEEQKCLGADWLGLESRRKWSTLSILSEMKSAGVTLEDVWGAYKSNVVEKAGVLLDVAAKEFLENKAKAGLRSRYADEQKRTVKRFVSDIGRKPIESLSHLDVEKWLDNWPNPSTRKTKQGIVAVLFSWATRQGYIAKDPMQKLEQVKLDEGDPEIFTVEQCKRLVEASAKKDPSFLPYLALALFQGIRPEECKRLEVEDIDLKKKQVTISGKAAKTRDRRIVPLQAPALAILEKCSQKNWYSFHTNFRRRRDAVRQAAGLTEWPKDVLRHTGASHFHNIFTMDEATKALGHSAATMLRHYRQLVDKEETEEWLKITP